LNVCFWRKPAYHLELFRDVTWAWRWRLVHRNGEILATSEAYSSATACLDTAKGIAKATGWEIVTIPVPGSES
jgi:uncharacterized protein YegP (UPF0339 family)